MPEVYIYVAEGRSVEQKRKVAREMTDVLTTNFNVPPEAVVVQLWNRREIRRRVEAFSSATSRRLLMSVAKATRRTQSATGARAAPGNRIRAPGTEDAVRRRREPSR
jgi:4-oxalocrotonate tautomerase